MARGDLYENRGRGRVAAPFLVDLQHELLEGLDTRVVAPLVREAEHGRRVERLHPLVEVGGERLVVATHLLTAVARRDLGPRRGGLGDHDGGLMNALDVLFTGV